MQDLTTIPPRIALGRGAGPRKGGPNTRGTGVGRGGVPVATAGNNVKTVGVKRPGYGTGGRVVDTTINAFDLCIPDGIIYHYDVVSERLPARVNMQLFNKLQAEFATNVFTLHVYDGCKLEEKDRIFHPAVYDGHKNVFTMYQLPLGDNNSGQFEVAKEHEAPPSKDACPLKVYTIKLTKVAEINTEILHWFITGQHSQDNPVLT